MKKLFSFSLVVGTSYTYSFYKMLDVYTHQSKNNLIQSKTINDKPYIEYICAVDVHLEYGFSCTLNSYKKYISFDILKTKKYDKGKWEQLREESCYQPLNINFFNIDSSKSKNIDEVKINSYSLGSFSYSKPLVLESDRKYKRNSKITIDYQENNIRLKDSTGKNIKFKRAFKNYVRSQKNIYEIDLPHVLTKIVLDSINPDINSKNEIETNSVSEMIKLNKFNYTDDQIKLLKNSKILAIWALPDKKYNNKEYIYYWNKYHPNNLKTVEYKKVNRIIIGYAVDKRTNETFNFITDLGQDISVLFDYDTQPKQKILTLGNQHKRLKTELH